MGGRVGFFWEARHSQIYPELARLEELGLVAHVVEQQERPDKKVYEITEAGVEALREWATEPPQARAAKDELVLKAYCVWLADPQEASSLFRDQERLHEGRLRRYEEIGAWMEEEWGKDLNDPGSPHFASYAVLRRGVLQERGYARWCGWVAERLGGESRRSWSHPGTRPIRRAYGRSKCNSYLPTLHPRHHRRRCIVRQAG